MHTSPNQHCAKLKAPWTGCNRAGQENRLHKVASLNKTTICIVS